MTTTTSTGERDSSTGGSAKRPHESGRADAVVSLFGGRAEASLFGGKAAALSRAATSGHRVPEGFVVTTAAFGAGVGAIREAIDQELARLGTGPFAVRSSAVAEDSASHSFAGQLETYLDVPRDGVVDAIERCWASANALRVLRYGTTASSRGAGPVAVLVQKMIPADVAGVAFSADPRTGERGVSVIEAVLGLGDRLVSGAVTPEAWRAHGETCVRTRGDTDEVLDTARAKQVARLAREMEALFGAPQDVEWAFAGNELHLLQSRPITALPAAPVPIPIETPAGDWQRDDHHAVLSPLGWEWFQAYPKAMAASMRTIGMPITEMRLARVGGHLYTQMVMAGGGGGAPPPRWILWLVSRVLPSMRRANRTCEDLLEREKYAEQITEWENEIRPSMRAAIDALFVEDPSTLDDEALLLRIGEVRALTDRGLAHHARLAGPPLFAVGKLALFVEDELHWPLDRAFELLAGGSEATTELHRSIERIVLEHEHELGGEDMPRTWAALIAKAPSLARALSAWQRENQLRVLHYDPKHATLGEQPDLVLSIAESIALGRRRRSEAPRAASASPVLDEARVKLTPERFSELERLIACGRRAYALRDENGVETVSRPSGLLRWYVRELGRRIEDAIGRPEHAVYLYPQEHAAALRGTLDGIGALIERRRGEESWALRNRGPARFGAAPPAMPTDAFPSGLARVFRIFAWMMRSETARDEAPVGASLVGTGIGTRAITARARVMDRPEELVSLRHGEVLVCRITSPEWSVALGRVGAIVTNEGGTLSHPAIIAREYGVSAVVGAAGATERIATGDVVTVDPIAGTVTLVSR